MTNAISCNDMRKKFYFSKIKLVFDMKMNLKNANTHLNI